MSIPSTLANVIIEGNTVESGGSFTYNYMLTSTADCVITGNYFSGITNNAASSIMLSLTNCTNNIQGNTFVRGSSSINAYIANSGSSDQIIVNNIFDSTTVDGASLTLASGLTASSLYEKNKNQTGYAVIPLDTSQTAIYSAQNDQNTHIVAYSLDSPYATPLTATQIEIGSGYRLDPYVIQVYENQVSPSQQRYLFTHIDLSRRVPVGAKITDAKVSVFNPSATTLNLGGGINKFDFYLSAGRSHTQSIDVKTYPSSSSGNTSMVSYDALYELSVTSGVEAALRSTYQVLDIPTTSFTGKAGTPNSETTLTNIDISSNFINTNEAGLTATLNFYYLPSGSAGSLPILIVSPIIVTYVW